jgi:hypothetical protein
MVTLKIRRPGRILGDAEIVETAQRKLIGEYVCVDGKWHKPVNLDGELHVTVFPALCERGMASKNPLAAGAGFSAALGLVAASVFMQHSGGRRRG